MVKIAGKWSVMAVRWAVLDKDEERIFTFLTQHKGVSLEGLLSLGIQNLIISVITNNITKLIMTTYSLKWWF